MCSMHIVINLCVHAIVYAVSSYARSHSVAVSPFSLVLHFLCIFVAVFVVSRIHRFLNVLLVVCIAVLFPLSVCLVSNFFCVSNCGLVELSAFLFSLYVPPIVSYTVSANVSCSLNAQAQFVFSCIEPRRFPLSFVCLSVFVIAYMLFKSLLYELRLSLVTCVSP